VRVRGLFLCSAGLGGLRAWLGQQGSGPRTVAFVDAAARPLEAAPFVGECKRALTSLGCSVLELDLTVTDPDETAAALSKTAFVFVTGGYPIYLLQAAQRSGFLDRARQRVRAGDLGYIGVSAGAALAGPSMEPLAAEDDPGIVTDFTALELVDFVTIPHVNRYPPEVFETRRAQWEGRFDLRPLADDSALSVTGEDVVTVVST
jgi:dipeptidase E